MLQDAGIKLSSVATRALGASGRAPAQMRLLAAPPIPRDTGGVGSGPPSLEDPGSLREALEGRFSAHHGLMVGRILAHIDYLDESIAELSIEIERVRTPLSPRKLSSWIPYQE